MRHHSTVSDIKSAFLIQAESCRNLGSPFTGRFCELFSIYLKPQGRVAEALFNWSKASQEDLGPYGASLPLRMASAFHGLVLEGQSETLASVYPPHHEGIDNKRLWSVFEAAMHDHADFILHRLQSPPQTNEVRRASAILPGFLCIARQTGLPPVLSEVGASAGLNLLWDQYSYQLGDQHWGRKTSPVRLTAQWSGPALPIASPEILSRGGCDLAPLDPAIPDQRARVLSYIWPDQEDRIALTRAALDIAAKMQPRIEKMDAVDWLKQRLSTTHRDATHVIYHTIMWQYLSPAQQKRGEDIISAAGQRATTRAPLAWLRLEADHSEPGAALMLTIWPTAQQRCIARADFHGRWIDWTGW